MKCQKCPNAATLHITEIISEDHVDELHLCEVCAHKYLAEPTVKSNTGSSGSSTAGGGGSSKQGASAAAGSSGSQVPLDDRDELSGGLSQECDLCGLKFVDFRNTGRLGCPHDYEVFHEELMQLLENIHGETRHVGKVPRRLPQSKQTQAELMTLRKQLLQAIHREAYEEAARLRDRIRQLEES